MESLYTDYKMFRQEISPKLTLDSYCHVKSNCSLQFVPLSKLRYPLMRHLGRHGKDVRFN